MTSRSGGGGALSNGQIGREIGELRGELRALNSRADAISSNQREHQREVIRRLEHIDAKLDTKADVTWMSETQKEVDANTRSREHLNGNIETALLLGKVANGIALIALGILGLLLAHGIP